MLAGLDLRFCYNAACLNAASVLGFSHCPAAPCVGSDKRRESCDIYYRNRWSWKCRIEVPLCPNTDEHLHQSEDGPRPVADFDINTPIGNVGDASAIHTQQ